MTSGLDSLASQINGRRHNIRTAKICGKYPARVLLDFMCFMRSCFREWALGCVDQPQSFESQKLVIGRPHYMKSLRLVEKDTAVAHRRGEVGPHHVTFQGAR